MLRKALHAEVSLLRLPLKVLDDRVVSRYTGADSRMRQTFETALAVVDQAAEMLADQPQQAAGGATPAHAHAHAPEGAAPAPAPATTFAPEAMPTPVPGEPLPEPEREEVAELADELLEEQEEETFAGELADDEELRRLQAELHAKHLVEETIEEAAEQHPETP